MVDSCPNFIYKRLDLLTVVRVRTVTSAFPVAQLNKTKFATTVLRAPRLSTPHRVTLTAKSRHHFDCSRHSKTFKSLELIRTTILLSLEQVLVVRSALSQNLAEINSTAQSLSTFAMTLSTRQISSTI